MSLIKILERSRKPTLIIFAATLAWSMGDAMIAFAAPTRQFTMHQNPGLQIKDIIGYATIAAILCGGWVAYAQLQFRKLSSIGRGLDEERKRNDNTWRDHIEKYNDDKLAQVKEYATKADLERIDQHMDRMRREFIDGLEKIENRIAGIYKHLDRED